MKTKKLQSKRYVYLSLFEEDGWIQKTARIIQQDTNNQNNLMFVCFAKKNTKLDLQGFVMISLILTFLFLKIDVEYN